MSELLFLVCRGHLRVHLVLIAGVDSGTVEAGLLEGMCKQALHTAPAPLFDDAVTATRPFLHCLVLKYCFNLRSPHLEHLVVPCLPILRLFCFGWSDAAITPLQ